MGLDSNCLYNIKIGPEVQLPGVNSRCSHNFWPAKAFLHLYFQLHVQKIKTKYAVFRLDLLIFLRTKAEITLPKAQRTRGLSSGSQSNVFRSYHKFLNKSWSNFIFIIWTISFELASSHARVTPLRFTKQDGVSQLVSQSVSDKGKQWSDSGPIIKKTWNEYNNFPWRWSDFSFKAVPNCCPDLNYQTSPPFLAYFQQYARHPYLNYPHFSN